MTDLLLIVIAIQFVLIVALLVARVRRARAERARRESGDRFHLMLDRSPAMLWSARPDMESLGIENSAELIHFAIKHGIVP